MPNLKFCQSISPVWAELCAPKALSCLEPELQLRSWGRFCSSGDRAVQRQTLQPCSEAPAPVRHWHTAPAEQEEGKGDVHSTLRLRGCLWEPIGLWQRSCCLCAHVPTHVLVGVWALRMRENGSKLLQLIHHRHLKIQPFFCVQK